MPGSRLKDMSLAATFAVLSVALAGASCEKKTVPPEPQPQPGDIEPAGDGHGHGNVPAPPHGKPYPDPKLDPDQQAAYDALAQKLPSPCGKPHSLAVSAQTDPSCKRTPFATRYVKRWLAEGVEPDQIVEIYAVRFGNDKPFQIDVERAAFEGVPNAPVQIVEFFDYGCSHCASTAPRLDDLVAEYPAEVVIYFMHFPLNLKGTSLQAAAAAVAAGKQGKFVQMHRKIFQAFGKHSKEDLFRHARELGLDMARFEADWNDPATREQILADRDQGDKLGIEGTPTLFVNGRLYIDHLDVADLRDWVNEELAVNR